MEQRLRREGGEGVRGERGGRDRKLGGRDGQRGKREGGQKREERK